MTTNPIQIIREATCWSHFCERLALFGSDPRYKKVKGDAFEYLTKFYLLTEPQFKLAFQEVHHHSELTAPLRDQLGLPHPEIGVDLVATLKDGTFCLIQCKFHQDSSQSVSYDELSTFFSITERNTTYEQLSHRLICTSADEITSRVSKIHNEKLGFITSFDYSQMDEARFDLIHEMIGGATPRIKPLTPRPHQTRAVNRAREYFASGEQTRGKFIHPCGAGKSLTAYWMARALGSGSVLIAVPSLALVKQTLAAWARESIANAEPVEFMAVCSDQDVSRNDDPAFKSLDLGIAVTTNAGKVANFINRPGIATKVVLVTYQSGGVIAEAADATQFKFDLGIFDEAHKTVGLRNKKFSLLIDDANVPMRQRIFMTATERVFRGTLAEIASMDDKELYGDIFDQLSFREALEVVPPILSDYRLITVTVSKREIENLIQENSRTKANGSAYSYVADGSTIAAMIALRRLTSERGIKHAISFHKSIQRAREFQELNSSVNLEPGSLGTFHSYHVSGKMSVGRRHRELERFRSHEPSVVSNARCLTEGVDIPAVDAVVFADPKQSVVDIVQASGRAMRVHAGKELGYIIIPVIIDDEDTALSDNAFNQLIRVVAAMGMNDDRIIDEAKRYASTPDRSGNEIMQFVEDPACTEVSFAELVDNLEIKIWDRLSFARSVVGESAFQGWIRNNKHLSPKTARNYGQAIRKISNDLVKLDMAFSSLEEITEHADLEGLRDKYFAIDRFKELDVRGKGMYSAGFNRLIEYQKFRQNDRG